MFFENGDDDGEHSELAGVGALVFGFGGESESIGEEMIPDSCCG